MTDQEAEDRVIAAARSADLIGAGRRCTADDLRRILPLLTRKLTAGAHPDFDVQITVAETDVAFLRAAVRIAIIVLNAAEEMRK